MRQQRRAGLPRVGAAGTLPALGSITIGPNICHALPFPYQTLTNIETVASTHLSEARCTAPAMPAQRQLAQPGVRSLQPARQLLGIVARTRVQRHCVQFVHSLIVCKSPAATEARMAAHAVVGVVRVRRDDHPRC